MSLEVDFDENEPIVIGDDYDEVDETILPSLLSVMPSSSVESRDDNITAVEEEVIVMPDPRFKKTSDNLVLSVKSPRDSLPPLAIQNIASRYDAVSGSDDDYVRKMKLAQKTKERTHQSKPLPPATEIISGLINASITKEKTSEVSKEKSVPKITQVARNPFLPLAETKPNPFTTVPLSNPFIRRPNPFVVAAEKPKNPFLQLTANKEKQVDIEELVNKRVAEELGKRKKRKTKNVSEDMRMDYKVVDSQNIGDRIRNLIPKGHTLIETACGSFVVPLYDDMTQEEQQRHRSTFKTRFKSLNVEWGGKHGLDEIEIPTADETLTNIHVRYEQTIRYIKQKNGCNFPKLFMMFCWGAVEVLAGKMGIDAKDYFESQLQMSDIYESKMIQMGQMGGFGEDWPAWIQLVVLSGVNLIMLCLFNKFLKSKGDIIDRDTVLRGVSNFISGKNSTLKEGADGIPRASSDPISNALGMNLGGMNVTNIATAAISGFSSMFGGSSDDDDEKPRKKKSKRTQKTSRETRREPKRQNKKVKEGPKSSSDDLPDEI